MTFWTDERIAELRRLAPDHTASQITTKLGAKSRSAVIGKIHRLKLVLNPDRPRGQERPNINRCSLAAKAAVSKTAHLGSSPGTGAIPCLGSSAVEPRPVKSVVAGSTPARDSTIGGRYQCDLVHLSATTCRFPCWGDATPIGERRYCGAMAVDGLPYCHAHCRIAYVGQGCDKLITHSVSPSSSQGESVPASFATARELAESADAHPRDSAFFCGND